MWGFPTCALTARVSRTVQPPTAGGQAEVSAPALAWVFPACTADPGPQVQSEAWEPLLYLRHGSPAKGLSWGRKRALESIELWETRKASLNRCCLNQGLKQVRK